MGGGRVFTDPSSPHGEAPSVSRSRLPSCGDVPELMVVGHSLCGVSGGLGGGVIYQRIRGMVKGNLEEAKGDEKMGWRWIIDCDGFCGVSCSNIRGECGVGLWLRVYVLWLRVYVCTVVACVYVTDCACMYVPVQETLGVCSLAAFDLHPHQFFVATLLHLMSIFDPNPLSGSSCSHSRSLTPLFVLHPPPSSCPTVIFNPDDPLPHHALIPAPLYNKVDKGQLELFI